MAQRAHLAKAPIHEALLDFTFVGTKASDTVLRNLVSTLLKPGWRQEEISEETFEIAPPKEGGGPELRSSSKAVVGFLLREVDGPRILQIREDRLTVSHVKLYTDWERLEGDARQALQSFAEVMQPQFVSRIAARFINRLPITNAPDFDYFLTNPPRLVEGLGDARVTDFIRRQVIRGLSDDFVAILNVGTVSTPDQHQKNQQHLLVDIDVFKAAREAIGEDFLRSSFSNLRKIKNDIFFGTLTDQALEPFR